MTSKDLLALWDDTVNSWRHWQTKMERYLYLRMKWEIETGGLESPARVGEGL